MKTTPEEEMKTEEKPTETTTPTPCNPLPPAFVLRHTEFGDVISHGLGMTNEGIKALRALVSGKGKGDGSLLRAIEQSRVKNLCFEWTQRHEINSFMATVASLHRDEESTREVLNGLFNRQALPPAAIVPSWNVTVDIVRLAIHKGGIEEIALSQVEDVLAPWIVQGIRRLCVFVDRYGEYEIVMNLDPGSWTIRGANGKSLTVPGASYTILHESQVIGMSPSSGSIGTSNCAFPFFDGITADAIFGIYNALDKVAISESRVRVSRGYDHMDLSECLTVEGRSLWEEEIADMDVMESAPKVTREKLIRDAESGYLFLLADGQYLSVRDANWCEGPLKKEDVAAAVRTFEGSPHCPGSLREAVACQHRLIQMACEVNWECSANPTPERIDAVLDAYREFCRFLEAQVKHLKSRPGGAVTPDADPFRAEQGV